MKKHKHSRYAVILFCIWLLPVFGIAQDCEAITRKQLKDKLEQMGFTVKMLTEKAGEEKYEVNHPSTDFNVPVAYEISASTNYIWLTAFLGNAEPVIESKSVEMLKENSKIQPCFFYITAKGNLMMGLAIENRGVTNTILRKNIDKIVSEVSKTAAIWQK